MEVQLQLTLPPHRRLEVVQQLVDFFVEIMVKGEGREEGGVVGRERVLRPQAPHLNHRRLGDIRDGVVEFADDRLQLVRNWLGFLQVCFTFF